ncbi:MAG: hypothetical protein VB081_03980 [Christensenella sp.]|uniref:hypothetical protein n=1 Tax=Christensenella sp. TaxID=1935934 RepID=UPI002B1F3786|nr:hypothetical protein [Christensenella sp.]MEA5002637.1 hypothetical protein [Christensenella sp.]
MKKVTGKIVACVAAISIMIGVLCSCAPFYSRAGEMMRNITEVRDRAEERAASAMEGVGDVTELAIDRGTAAAERAFEEIGDALEWSDATGWAEADDTMKQYEPFGITYDEVNGENWYNGKPLAGLYDAGYNTVTNSSNASIGSFVVIERDRTGKITGAYETDKENFKELAHIDIFENGEKGAREMGYDYVREDAGVKGLDRAAFTKLENELRVKYRNQNVFVECKDYVFCFSKEDMLSISSCCYMDTSSYAARVSIDYQQNEGIDLNLFDNDKTDEIIMDTLRADGSSGQSIEKVSDAIREAVSKAYGIDWKYVYVDVMTV